MDAVDPVITVSKLWASMDADARSFEVRSTMYHYQGLELVSTSNGGHIIVKFKNDYRSIAREGSLLMGFERYLRFLFAEPLEVYCEPTVDKNKLRAVLQRQVEWQGRRDKVREDSK